MAEFSVYTKTGSLRMTFHASDNSNHTIAIKEDSILSLSMIMQQCVRLEPGDYVDFISSRFWTLEAYTPKQASTVEWTYEVKFYGVESIIKQALMLSSEGVPLQAYHAPAHEQLQMVVMNLNRWMGNITDWKAGACVATENLDIDYSGGAYCNEALNKIAEAAGVEWWMEGMTINLTKAEHTACGDPVTGIELGYGNGLTSIDRDNADNVPFFTRLFPIGSTRNIEYSRYGNARLQLPTGAKYVERNAEQYGVVERYEEEAFAEIYPRRTGYVSTVRMETAHNDDGTEYAIYYFKDQSLNFNPNSYEMSGLVKHIIFQDGDVAGRDFEVNYNATTQEFEIITTWPYDDDTQVPGGLLVPKPGDAYILYNIRMPDEYYPLAEQEFAVAVEAYLNEHSGMTDRSVYKCHTNYINLDARGITLTIGQRVRLFSNQLFPGTGYRDSRITRISRKVERPNEADIDISGVLSQTSQSSMQESIAKVSHEIRTAASTFPDILRSWDNTLPTDNNIFSARRALREALSKKQNDSAAGLIRFLSGAEFGQYESGESGAKIYPTGEAELMEAVIRQMLRSSVFVDGFTGEGFGLWKDDVTGLANLTLDKLTVRQTMSVMELLINKVRSVGGQIIVSAANGKIKTVTQNSGYYLISFETENTFVAHDLVRCSTFTGNALKSYWVEVSSADANGITVPVSEFAGQVPVVGDECVLMGNATNPLRQNLISIAATEDGQPRIDVLNGVSQKNFNGCLRARVGNLDGIQDSWFPLDNQPHGNGIYADNAFLRGTFLLVTGEDIKTKFEITEGLIQSSVESIRQDFIEDKGFLSNATFGEGMSKWDTQNEAVFFLANNKWIWLNNHIYSNKGDYAAIRKDGGRTTVFIKNKYISQTNDNLRSKPTFDVTTDGFGVTRKNAKPVYISFFYRVVTPGTLSILFEDVDKTGFHDFNSLGMSADLDVTDGYEQFTGDGLWNGTGDFKLSFTGEIYLYMLVLSTDKVESLKYQYQTLFEQSEKLVRIAATNFDSDGNPLQSSQIITKADMNYIASGIFDNDGNVVTGAGLITKSDIASMFVINAEGNLVSLVEASAEGIKLKADNISLEGLVTVNQHFAIDEDGNMWAMDCHLSGEINATSGSLGNWIIGENISNGLVQIKGDGTIKNDVYWELNQNGSGFLAKNNVVWDNQGNVTIKGILKTPFINSNSMGAVLSDKPNLIFNWTTADDIAWIGWSFYGDISYDGTVVRAFNNGIAFQVKPFMDEGYTAVPTRFVGKRNNEFTFGNGEYIEMIAAKDPNNTSRVMWIIAAEEHY
jgi:hypothetical protein